MSDNKKTRMQPWSNSDQKAAEMGIRCLSRANGDDEEWVVFTFSRSGHLKRQVEKMGQKELEPPVLGYSVEVVSLAGSY